MNYIIFDLEWNQCSGSIEKREEKLPFEIVEIGAVKLNENREMIGEFSELIKPQIYHQMHYITSKLVHLHMSELETGSPFVDVMKRFLEWCGDDVIFCTWGSVDLIELQRNMSYYNMKPLSDGPLKYLDIQKLFSLAYEDGKSRRALEYAIDMLHIDKDIPFHRAFSDAYYTAKVFDNIEDPDVLEKFSFDVYHLPKTKEDEIYIKFSSYAKYISREFNDKQELMSCKDVINTKCYKCGHNLKKKVKWYTINGKHYYAVSSCFRHGLMKSKLRIRKSEDGKIYAVKTDKFITKDDVKELLEKKEQAIEQKRLKKEQKEG